MKKYYVYQLVDSLTGEIFYIGKGSGGRLYKHVSIAKGNSKNKRKNPKLYNKINKILRNNGKILVTKIFESDDEAGVLKTEKKIITKIGLEFLTNLTEGGDGTSFPNGFSDKHRKNISLSMKGRISNFKGKKLSEESKLNISLSMKGKISNFKGKKLSKESKLEMSLAKKGKLFSKKHKENISKALIGRSLSLDHKENIFKAHLLKSNC